MCMTELATPGQLRLSYWRWAMVTVPAIVLIGSLTGLLANSGYGNRWFAALDLPPIVPPGWIFALAWTILYEIGRASCRERVCQYVWISVGAVSLKNKQVHINICTLRTHLQTTALTTPT